MNRLCLYYRPTPETDRWIRGDRFVRPPIRRIVRGKPAIGGIGKVLQNLCLGLDRLGVDYMVNLPFKQLKDGDRVGVLGRGRHALDGYERRNPIVAGIALMSHPSEWPTLCDDYPVKYYLQHSKWANDIYRPYFGDRCAIWPVGIDTESWTPGEQKDVDLLIYDKIMWDRGPDQPQLLRRVLETAAQLKLNTLTIRYGMYKEADYRRLLARSKGMIFLCEHESQGIACQECLSCDVPVLAWDQGYCLDPNRFAWGQAEIPATSVPYFDARCGERFSGLNEFDEKLSLFLSNIKASAYRPREFILENLTLTGSAKRFLSFFD
jgi:hypothetical protein